MLCLLIHGRFVPTEDIGFLDCVRDVVSTNPELLCLTRNRCNQQARSYFGNVIYPGKRHRHVKLLLNQL
jgi:hypothetical protein